MQLEHERRFRLTSSEYRQLLRSYHWSPPYALTDVTMGPAGPRSMATHGWILRLRIVEGRTQLEFKGETGDEAVHLEAGVGVESARCMAQILVLSGFRLGLVITRSRRTCDLPGTRLALDDAPLLGRFLEIETATDRDVPVADPFQGLNAPAARYGDLILERTSASPSWRRRYRETSAAVLHELGLCYLMEESWPHNPA